MGPFVDILKFIEDIRIRKALTDMHKCYKSHVTVFWNAAHYVEEDKAIYSTVKMKDENHKDIDVAVKIIVGDIRSVLELNDKDEDPIHVPERLCKGLWFRMGYTGFVNDPTYHKSKLSKPYKFLIHSVVHALGHRKGGYDESVDYVMNIITCLILNRPYNISQMIFIHMLDNIKGEKFLQYPRFVQMLQDDQIANLPKEEDDELVLHHMDNETLRRLNVYRGQPTEPPSRKKFAAIAKSDYEAPADDKWGHDNSDSGTETEKMSLFEPKRSRWWVKVDDKKKKKRRTPTQTTPKASTPKAAAKRIPKKKKTPTTPHLVDEPSRDEAQHGGDNVVGGDNEIFYKEIEQIIADTDAAEKAQNAEKASGEAGGEKAGGENVETVDETLVEGVVRTDSSETESNIDLTQIAPTTSHNEKRGRKAGPSRKRKKVTMKMLHMFLHLLKR
ncbi:hypothetical protein HanRHA438_Chr12g0564771 [Helianthus annuus]|uniref:Uncharacterized protein n=1 Tax=Helianthus annuus TaxID=4232 RepID=A0A9K3HIJ8_HELAN|nr:hypothetical protein HanXRQr2_Chr12g0553461 [Helianthus annuus]KAJ0494434.1 hypothetical protein HanIR_Chr12g0597441 [Helianthus annuus]KAJ0506196.1 hypothetical protein HanHA89_Chr12g0479211 [Helianthus annuus]KAJ0675867.1 hypothetical protein HanLR1_Chr12g0456121 [Helianthus annuus]KAJ0679118.1 hypothetical protein HanOQP8_Chr12g0455721 [Helianthus annuus]